MASSELIIDDHKLKTVFFSNYVQHTIPTSDASGREPSVEVSENWRRCQRIGGGCSGIVYKEQSNEGGVRAVKVMAKGRHIPMVNYKRELMAMAVSSKHHHETSLFVKLFGWYENDDSLYIAMEYISHGNLRSYMWWGRGSESEVRSVIRQNILVVSKSPIWVKIGDFGLAKLARAVAAVGTNMDTSGYIAPEVGSGTETDTPEYTYSVDIWAVGCITHELLTRSLPFRTSDELVSYGQSREFPRGFMSEGGTSQAGIEFVVGTLAYKPEDRIAASEALVSEWLSDPPQEYNYESPHFGSRSPQPPTLGFPPPLPVRRPSSLQQWQSTSVWDSQSMEMQRPPGGGRSIYRIRPVTEFVARDIDLGAGSPWWGMNNALPLALQDRIGEFYYEINVFHGESYPHDTRAYITKRVYVLFHDYSQTVITAHYGRNDPTNDTLSQQHQQPPSFPRQDQLEDFHVRYGKKIYDKAESLQGTMVGDGKPHTFIDELFSLFLDALPPVGRHAYGALVYAKCGAGSAQRNGEIRPGDIITFRDCTFGVYEGRRSRATGAAILGLTVLFPGPDRDYVAVVASWDEGKQKVKAYEQGRASKLIRIASFKMGELESGEVKVWRVAGRDWIGWHDQGIFGAY